MIYLDCLLAKETLSKGGLETLIKDTEGEWYSSEGTLIGSGTEDESGNVVWSPVGIGIA